MIMAKIQTLLRWVTDPFDKNKVLSKHSSVISDLHEAKAKTSVIVSQKRKEMEDDKRVFPISNMVGNTEYRKKTKGL